MAFMACFFFLASPTWAQLDGGSTANYDKRVKEAIDQIYPGKYKITDAGNFNVTLNTPGTNGRTQLIIVSSKTTQFQQLEVRQVYAYCYKSTSKPSCSDIEKVLKKNEFVKFGYYSLYEKDDYWYIFFNAQISAKASSELMQTVIDYVNITADGMELELTGKDDY
jgi:hypothetical protein